MDNKMRRECVIIHPVVVNGGKPFDVLTASPSFDTNDGILYVLYYKHGVQRVETLKEGLDDEEGSLLCTLLEWQLAQALNPLIKVSRLVLDAMEKVPEAKFNLVLDDVLPFTVRTPRRRTTPLFFNNHPDNICWYGYPDGDAYNMERVAIDGYTHYIQADCPLALQVLLDFNEEGELFDA